MLIDRQIPLTIFLLLFVVVIFGITNIDIFVQDMFYDFKEHTWWLGRDIQPWKFIFYDGIKKLLILIGVLFLVTLIFFRKNSIVQEYKHGMIIVVLSAIFIPAIVGGLKKTTNMPCPKNEIHYGGKLIRTAVWQIYPQPYKNMEHIACWPAGHASGGFALMSLFFLFKTKRNKLLALSGALALGWTMGIYKMLIGDHFLSHTLITMILSWLLIIMINKPIVRWVQK
ncbi:MAG TPA: phosphoesterase [Sulfurospirillum sp. UBA12182]|jgi:membrane-associated PAP2 superfamily phosphatase|nr:MAG TPA: phosphoesterase [Sulfurospirillum sp. UBA12182]